jgi:hypothetical protein
MKLIAVSLLGPNHSKPLICRLYPDELKALYDYIPYNPTRDLFASDSKFWQLSGGYCGMFRKLYNSVCYVVLCKRLPDMPRDALGFLWLRTFGIFWCLVFSYLESLWRAIWRLLAGIECPHVCAQWATHLYWELETRANSLNLDYGTENWNL